MVQARERKGRRKKWEVFGLKTGQRRDVPESDYNCDVPESGNDVATLESNVVMFQRSANSTSRRCNQTSRRSRGVQNQRHNV